MPIMYNTCIVCDFIGAQFEASNVTEPNLSVCHSHDDKNNTRLLGDLKLFCSVSSNLS